ncbi:MAG: HAMP domain-containing histidine kinase [Candidatus Stahlbacteria bacterium]|nr:HAMP domain-containing histidine kinase [Candidatus Stahlbacteria bacterium]
MYESLNRYLVFTALAIVAGFVVYSQYMIREIEREAETISRVYGKFCSRVTEDETSVVFDEIITKINFPVIVTSPEGDIISKRNVEPADSIMVAKLDNEHTPVKIEYEGKLLALVHYGDSKLRKLLKFAPLVQVSLGGLLFVIGIIWLAILKRSEENALFAGISKETAHQLGTPITALIGWQELIKDESIKLSFQQDLERLKSIATRFHKIGSPPQFRLQAVSDILDPTIEYLENRIPRNVKITKDYSNSVEANIDNELFSWAIENLIKNAVDAGSTKITLSINANKYLDIIIKDNGKGVAQRISRKIFSPGYTTKEYGWGIGLSLVQRIAKMHHGKIIYKPNKESGASFIIRLKR